MKFETNLVGRRVHVQPTLGKPYDGEIVLVRECPTNLPLRVAFVVRPDTDAELAIAYPGKDRVEVYK